jgi:hypothetical protein
MMQNSQTVVDFARNPDIHVQGNSGESHYPKTTPKGGTGKGIWIR